MERLMKKTKLLLIMFLIIGSLVSRSLSAYELATHARLTREAINRSILILLC